VRKEGGGGVQKVESGGGGGTKLVGELRGEGNDEEKKGGGGAGRSMCVFWSIIGGGMSGALSINGQPEFFVGEETPARGRGGMFRGAFIIPQ